MLASDVNNPEFTGATNPDSALIVTFYNRPVQNNYESSKQGRPIYEDVIYVKINIPGRKDLEIDRPALSDHAQRFPMQYQHFLNKTQGDSREIGTPLSEWPILTRSQAEEFRAMKFFTVESIANAADQAIHSIGMVGGMAPYVLRDKARAFLAAATNAALPQHQAEELAKRDAEISLLKEQIQALAAGKPLPQGAEKRGPGRPSNAELAARKAAA